jgi:hypothetical protein
MRLRNELGERFYQTLLQVLSTKFNQDIIEASHEVQTLQGGTVGIVYLITGVATSNAQINEPYKLVLKIQNKWERYGDINSWRREYDLYASDLNQTFPSDFSWPECYHMALTNDSFELWMEYIDAPSGQKLTLEMYQKSAEAIGRFQGNLFRDKPDIMTKINNLSSQDYVKSFYYHYCSWNEVYDYIRSSECDLPKDICQMIIDLDDNDHEIFEQLDQLPIVFCHRDYWNTNLFYLDDRIIAIDWDTAGYGYFGEDIASLVADETDPSKMVDYFRSCIAAYVKGFSQYVDIKGNVYQNIHNIILLMFGYRLVESYKFASNQTEKALAKDSLQSIFDMRIIVQNN